jgi:hypothetical protein
MPSNGFSYDESRKTITIVDGTSIVNWENVEKNVADEAGTMFGKSESIDRFLLQNGCKRYWGDICKSLSQ